MTPQPAPTPQISALDGLGDFGCADRAAAFLLNGQLATIATDAPCSINITSRTEDSLAGTITATLVDANGASHTLAADFRHDDTPARAAIGINTGTDVCVSGEVTHTVETVGTDTVDVFESGVLNCQANPATTLSPIGFRRVRPRSDGSPNFACGEGVNVTSSDASTNPLIGGGCRTAAPASNGDGVLRFVFYDVVICLPPDDCDSPLPVVYMQYDLSAPAN